MFSKRNLSIVALLLVTLMSVALVGCATQQEETTATTSGDTTATTEGYTLPDGFPTKNIQIISPFSLGSTTATYVQVLATWINENYKMPQNIIVVEKSGGGGVVGTNYSLGEAAADGYTIAWFNSPLMQLPLTNPDALKWDENSFEKPIIAMCIDPGCVSVGPDLYKTVTDLDTLVAYAKTKPGEVSVCTTGLTTSEARACHQLENLTGTSFKIVPYDSSAEGVAAVMGGHLDVAWLNTSDMLAQINSGDVVAIATGDVERDPFLPDVTTFQEQGYDFRQFSMRTLYYQNDIPDDIYAWACKAFAEAQQSEEAKKAAADMQFPVVYKTPEEVKAALTTIWNDTKALWETSPWQ